MFSIITVLILLHYIKCSDQKVDSYYDVLGLSIDNCEETDGRRVEFSNGIPIFHSKEHQQLNIYGINISSGLQVGITSDKDCNNVKPIRMSLEEEQHIGRVSFTSPSSEKGLFSQTRYYVCTKDGNSDWTFHNDDQFGFYIYEPLFTTEILIVILVLSYCLSSLMSGLNIGLFTLNPHELEMLKASGTAKEKKYAKIILPVRTTGNYLLCSLLITVTLCNAISTVTANQFFSNWFTIVFTTCVLVLLCEILPQSVCTTYPLFVGAYTIHVTRACMLITAPISYPLAMILDRLVGKESLSGTYNKERIQELLAMTQLPTEEVKFITGTLKLGCKTVEEIMTVLNDVFKLPITAVLDVETIAMIMASGFSRIPIYVGNSSNIQYMLLTKDLALLDPEDRVPVKVLVNNIKLKCHYIHKTTALDKLLEIFKDSRNHMVFVVDETELTSSTSHSEEIPHNEVRNVVGVVTFEDVIEEIFQMEINDETDKYSDNRIKKKLDSDYDLHKILKKPEKGTLPSKNLKLAIFKFLSEMDVFASSVVSPTVLQTMLNMDIYYTATGQHLPQDIIFTNGKPADFFVMILEGEMEIKIGNEALTFSAGAFHYFGVDALKKPFIPDYTLEAIRRTKYIRISKVLYEAAVYATQYERSRKSPAIAVNSDLYVLFNQFIDK